MFATLPWCAERLSPCFESVISPCHNGETLPLCQGLLLDGMTHKGLKLVHVWNVSLMMQLNESVVILQNGRKMTTTCANLKLNG